MPAAGGICLGAGDLATDPAGRLAIHPGHALDLALAGAATLAGLGITKLPENVVRADLTDGRLERAPPQGNAPLGIVHVVFPARRGLLPAVRALIDFLAAKLPSSIGQ